jgi:hypothetical protein
MEPRLYHRGLYFAHTINVVRIESRIHGIWIDSCANTLMVDYDIPSERIYSYIPPESVSHKKMFYFSNGKRYSVLTGEEISPRTESIPRIACPDETYIVIDHVLDTGRTLECAEKALQTQGVSDIWAYIARMHGYGEMYYLDRPSVFYEFARELGNRNL